jgi:hypothetical protein
MGCGVDLHQPSCQTQVLARQQAALGGHGYEVAQAHDLATRTLPLCACSPASGTLGR